jgi:hypothetical protein
MKMVSCGSNVLLNFTFQGGIDFLAGIRALLTSGLFNGVISLVFFVEKVLVDFDNSRIWKRTNPNLPFYPIG